MCLYIRTNSLNVFYPLAMIIMMNYRKRNEKKHTLVGKNCLPSIPNPTLYDDTADCMLARCCCFFVPY